MAFVLIGIGPQRTTVNVHMHVVRKSALQVPGHCLVGPFFAPPARKSKKQPLPSTKAIACCGGDFGPIFAPSETGHAWGNSKHSPSSLSEAQDIEHPSALGFHPLDPRLRFEPLSWPFESTPSRNNGFLTPLVSLNKANCLNPYFWGCTLEGGVGWPAMRLTLSKRRTAVDICDDCICPNLQIPNETKTGLTVHWILVG